MNKLLSPLFLLYKLWVGFVFWISLLLLFPAFWILMQRKSWFKHAFKLKRFWSQLFQVLLFCPVKSQWLGEKPEPPYVIASNHSSYVDTVFFYSVFSDYFLFIGKSELLKWPLFGAFFKYMDIPVARENLRDSYKALRKAHNAIKHGECIAIYPEGTVPLDSPRMGNFKNGAFRLAIEEQVPILPVTWTTNYRIFSDPSTPFIPSYPQMSRAVIHPAISTKGMTEADIGALRKQVFEAIDSAIPEAYRRTN